MCAALSVDREPPAIMAPTAVLLAIFALGSCAEASKEEWNLGTKLVEVLVNQFHMHHLVLYASPYNREVAQFNRFKRGPFPLSSPDNLLLLLQQRCPEESGRQDHRKAQVQLDKLNFLDNHKKDNIVA